MAVLVSTNVVGVIYNSCQYNKSHETARKNTGQTRSHRWHFATADAAARQTHRHLPAYTAPPISWYLCGHAPNVVLVTLTTALGHLASHSAFHTSADVHSALHAAGEAWPAKGGMLRGFYCSW